MDSETESTRSHTESEEDLGCYYLQPASSPYNIIEKIHDANVDLYNSPRVHELNEKESKVKFKTELVSFEPDSTDDDINSIESDQIEILATPTTIDHKMSTTTDITIFNIEEEAEEYVEEEIIEDLQSDYDEGVKEVKQVCKTEVSTDPNTDTTNTVNEVHSKRSKKKLVTKENKEITLNPREIHCDVHCIDKLDFDLCTSIQKLEINDVRLPPLQLLQRKCCNDLNRKLHKNLPNYKGLRSEYGLSSRQLDQKEKQAEMMKMREQTRRRLLEEYRHRKLQQNEEVFMQWLKEVTKRKSEQQQTKIQKHATSKQPINSRVNTSTTLKGRKVKGRPKTANEFRRKPSAGKVKKLTRPHTAHSCVCIEIPQSLIEQGLSIGDLTITSSKVSKRRLHILTVS